MADVSKLVRASVTILKRMLNDFWAVWRRDTDVYEP